MNSITLVPEAKRDEGAIPLFAYIREPAVGASRWKQTVDPPWERTANPYECARYAPGADRLAIKLGGNAGAIPSLKMGTGF